MRSLFRKLKEQLDNLRIRLGLKDPPSTPGTPDGPPIDPGTGWRDDVASFPIQNRDITFQTLDVLPANTPDGRNRDGGFEWIIARIEGSGYRRLLLMVMGGSRPPTRIYHQFLDGNASLNNSAFTVPLPGVHTWRVRSDGSRMTVSLDGRQIWEARGDWGMSTIVFNGYASRGFRGKWRLGG